MQVCNLVQANVCFGLSLSVVLTTKKTTKNKKGRNKMSASHSVDNFSV